MKKRIVLLLITMLAFAVIFPQSVNAATGKISVSVSNTKPVIGNRITLKITVSSANGFTGKAQLVYDTSYLTLVSHTVGENYSEKTRQLIFEPTSNSSATYSFVFETRKVGNTTVTLNTLQFIDYESYTDLTGYSDSISTKIAIQAKTNNNPSTTTLSADCSLSLLSVKDYAFEEAFSSARYEYTLYVPNGVKTLDITAKASSGKAKIKEINSGLQEGWNKIEVVCVAENKKEQSYVINVYVEETPKVFFEYKGKQLGAVVNVDRVELEGFNKNELENFTEFVNEGYELLYLIDEEGVANFYQYDSDENLITGMYQPVTIENRRFILTDVDYDKFPEMSPEDFYRTRIEIGSLVLYGWKYNAENMKDMVIIYLKDELGVARLYQYDMMDKTIQRFIKPVVPQPEPEPEPMFDQKDYIIMGASGIAVLISLIYGAVMGRKFRKFLKEQQNELSNE